MIWVHCGEQSEITTTLSLASRLIDQVGGSEVLITCDDTAAFDGLPQDVTCVNLPPDTPTKVRKFLHTYAPSSLIWNAGNLRPTMLRAVEAADIPATLINARNDGILPGKSRWLPRAARGAVAAFRHIMTADGATATRLSRGGVTANRIEATGPILEEPIPLHHDQYELTVMAEAFGTRPVWLAADVVEQELVHMVAAHLMAVRKNHRLLMILSPRNMADGAKAATLLRDAGLRVGVRSEGDDPEAEHQAYVADLPDELGLWYRIAPLTFMGGTMSDAPAASPFAPIVLGSAVVHGPQKSPHKTRYERLFKADASREVRSAPELGMAISFLISPEQAARMALAGWDETTRNAAIINRLVAAAVADISTGAEA